MVEMRTTPTVTLYTQAATGLAASGRVGHYQLAISWGTSLAAAGLQTSPSQVSIASVSPGRGATGPNLMLWNFTADAEL